MVSEIQDLDPKLGHRDLIKIENTSDLNSAPRMVYMTSNNCHTSFNCLTIAQQFFLHPQNSA